MFVHVIHTCNISNLTNVKRQFHKASGYITKKKALIDPLNNTDENFKYIRGSYCEYAN